MNPIIALLTSSLGKKYLMAISGVVLSLFVLGHMVGKSPGIPAPILH